MTSQMNRGWRVRWFNKWEYVLDEALDRLPEHPQWPNTLLRILFEAPGSVPKKVALVLDGDAPIALVGLRYRGSNTWEPLTNYIVPGFLIVGKQELTTPVLMNLPTSLQLAWWRMPIEAPSPALRTVRAFKVSPTHILPVTEDPEVYWRRSHYLDSVRRARRKSAHFEFAVNAPGALQWTIRNWEAKWRGDAASQRSDLADRLVADEFLQMRGQHVTFALLDGDQLIAGDACVVDNGDLVSLVTYRRPEYRAYYLGHALTDRMVAWAKQSGFQRLDLGGGFDYKNQLAPVGGQKVELLICPELRYRFGQVMRYGRALRGRVLREAPRLVGVAQRARHRVHRGIQNFWPARVER